MRLKDKVAIITGGARGIGEATAKKFVEEGAKVVIADINEKELLETEEFLKELGGDVMSIVVDVTDSASVNNMIEKTVQKYLDEGGNLRRILYDILDEEKNISRSEIAYARA